MPNFKQAPKLYHNKADFKYTNYYNLPQNLMDVIFQKLDGKCGNQIKLMTVLLGTLGDGSFGVSEKWICDRTGMIQQSYNAARKALIERGWIYLEEGKLYVLPAIIIYGFPPYKNDPNLTDEENKRKQKELREDTNSNCVNAIKKQMLNDGKTQDDIVPKAQFEIVSKAQDDIVYNKINNRNNSNINNIRVDDLSPNGANSSTRGDNYEVAGEITRDTADNIIDKQCIGENLIFVPASGKYFKIRG